jgi:hypothetical protein
MDVESVTKETSVTLLLYLYYFTYDENVANYVSTR